MTEAVLMTVPSPIGPLRLVARDDVLTHLYLPPHDEEIAAVPGTSPALARAAAQLAEYFAGERRAFDLPLEPRGTGFQERVWRALLAIPYGETRSYGEQARSIGRPAASRAVGAANGRNPIAIIIPCHRVIGADGSLTGFGGGLPAKKWLLEHEARLVRPRLFDRVVG
ncbi:MAG: methylated-DNA--[protein]-cysteine S-methyltransferase [Deltaproteobacteria bacterium]|nr:methylated-DNA--[protein]-cysteine S-methyltransferase [Deltaproteobacteria bacterium]